MLIMIHAVHDLPQTHQVLQGQLVIRYTPAGFIARESQAMREDAAGPPT